MLLASLRPSHGSRSSLIPAQAMVPMPHWRRFDWLFVAFAVARTMPSPGNRMPMRRAMMPTVTINSTMVKARDDGRSCSMVPFPGGSVA